MSLKHGKLISASGTRKVLNIGNGQSLIDVLQWQTTDGEEPQELELLVYASAVGIAGATSANVYRTLMLELEISLGDVALSTTEIVANDRPYATLHLPNNGLRMRFCARRARLRIFVANLSIAVQLNASMTPCRGMVATCVPSGYWPNYDYTGTPDAGAPYNNVYTPLPKGARFLRAYCPDVLGSIRLYDPTFPDPVLCQEIPVAACSDWCPISPKAYYCAYGPSSVAAQSLDHYLQFCVQP